MFGHWTVILIHYPCFLFSIEYDVHLNTGHSLDASSVPSYALTLQCTDGTASSGVLTVNVQANTPPDITSLPTTASVTAGEAGGRTLHTLAVTETDPYTCTLASSPASSQFILNYAASGTSALLKGMTGLCESCLFSTDLLSDVVLCFQCTKLM